jgi:predicted transcriptional regulator
MKMITHREYRNDISDAIGILIEEAEAGNHFSYDEIDTAYQKLYHELPDPQIQKQFQELCAKSIEELKILYDSQKDTESVVSDQLITYIEDGVNINTKNVTDVAARIRENMCKKQS